MEGEEESVLPFVMDEGYAYILSIEVEEGDFSVCTKIYVVKCVYSVRSIPAVDEEDRGEGCQGRVVYKYCT